MIYFFIWTFFLYWIHRFSHKSILISKYHWEHHHHINTNNKSRWHWNNLLLFNDTRNSTIDLWITEVIPTILFSLITGQWWISILYYCWAGFLQEPLEHNPRFNIPLLTSGKWHLIHHKTPNKNFSLFFPIWDLVFNTESKVD